MMMSVEDKSHNRFLNKYSISGLVLVALIGIYLNWPAPELSKRVIEWRYTGKYFKFKNYYRIFYQEEFGNGPEEEVLVLLHGFPSSSHDWSRILSKLKLRFGRVIAPDFLGFGFSDKPLYHHIFRMNPAQVVQVEHNYTIFEQAEIIQSLLHHLDIGKVHLLAHDFGDTVAQELLHRHNHYNRTDINQTLIEIKTVCLLNGGIFPEMHKARWSQEISLHPVVGNYLPRLLNYWIFSRELASTFGQNTKPVKEDLLDWWALVRQKEGHTVLPKLLQYIPQRRQNRERWINAIKDTKAKVHFIYGPLDPINPHPFAQHFRNTFPLASLDTIPDVGHYVQWEAPDGTVESYFKFLDSKYIKT